MRTHIIYWISTHSLSLICMCENMATPLSIVGTGSTSVTPLNKRHFNGDLDMNLINLIEGRYSPVPCSLASFSM